MTSWSFWVAPSRMIAETALFETRISLTATRPEPSALFNRSWATTPRSDEASMVRTCACWSAGKTSMMRSTVLRALFVCKSAEDQQAGLGGGQRQGNRLQIAHFADQNDVGILPKGGFQAGGKADRVLGNLALCDDAPLVPMNEFDGLLDGDDVAGEVGVDVVDQRRQGRALAGTRGAGDQNDPAAHFAE